MRRFALIALVATSIVLKEASAEEHRDSDDPFLGVEEFVTVRKPEPLHFIELPKSEFAGGSSSDFSRLSDGSTVEIQFNSRGCFHDRKWNLKILGGANPKAQISDADAALPSRRTWHVPLSAEDLVGLDRLLDYYKSPRPQGCTTTEQIVLRWKKPGDHFWERRTERFDDESCGFMSYNNILWLWDLVLRDRAKVTGRGHG